MFAKSSGQCIEDSMNMFKRKNTTDEDDLPQKRSRLSDEASTSDASINENSGDGTVDLSVNQQPTTSPYKRFFGKFIPNLSWSKAEEHISEKGDNPGQIIADKSSSPSVSGRNSLSPRKASSIITNSKGTVVLVGKIKLKNKWTNDLLQSTSEDYKTMTTNYIKLIDDLLHNSNVSKVYMNSVVVKYSNIPNSSTRATRKSPGNVMVHSEMTFHHTYTKLFTDIQELCDNVEDFITLQFSLGEMDDSSLQIDDTADSVSVAIEKEENTEEPDDDTNNDLNGLSDNRSVEENAEDNFVDAKEMNVDEVVQDEEHTIDDQNNETASDKQEMEERTVQQEPERQGNSGIGTGSQDDSGTGTESHEKSGTGTGSQDNVDTRTGSRDTEMIEVIEEENIGTSDGKETKDEVSTADGEQIEITVGDAGEGEQIVVGKKRISDVVSEPVDVHVDEYKKGKAKTRKVDSKKNTPKQKSSTGRKEDQPSGSGLKSKPIITRHVQQKEESDSDNGRVPSEPGVPTSVAKTSNAITLKWSRPRKGFKLVDHYEIKYKECKKGKGKWISVLSEGAERTVKVKDLKAEMEYEFKVRAVNEDGEEGPFCQPSVKLSTVTSLARSLIPMANLLEDGHPKVYKLPLTKHVDTVNERAKTRKCVFGVAPENLNMREKTIMVIGATGSGKTTLVDGMINYITDVSWEDEFRFSLIDLTDDEKKRKASEAESQTEWITCYTINKMEGSTIDYTLNIIDTPGFGDTRGIVRDKTIVDQIREFFTTPGRQGISCLDAVCFVTQGPLGKLTTPQRYIFDQILSVFGQDIKSNIFVLITFADANEPPVRAALKAANVPYQKSFKFNNSALYASPENPEEAEMGNLFWKMGKENFKIFFDELKTVESKSLLLTSEVLQLRKRIEATIQGLQQQIADGMNKLNTIKQEREILKRHKADIKAKKDFTYEVDEVHMYQVDLELGVYVTNCMSCNRTCHFPCGIPDDHNKQNCAAIDHQLCTVCPMNCHWTLHKNNNFRFDTYSMKVTKTYEELKQKYEIAQKEAEKHKSVLGKIKMAFTSLGNDVMKMVHEVRCNINKLNDIALRPNPLSDKDYIDLLIENEKNERKYGWEQRIRLFYKLREEAELVEQMHQQDYQPWILDDSDESDDESSQDNTDDDKSTADEEFDVKNIKTENPDVEMA